MKTCCYCGSELEKTNQTKYYCDFCDMVLTIDKVTDDGKRIKPRIKDVAFEIYISKSTPELMVLSTFELLSLLKYIRQQRREDYDRLQQVKKLVKGMGEEGQNIDEFIPTVNDAAKNYEYTTRKMFIFENLVCERLGYTPKRITEKFLLDYSEQIQENKDSDMVIRRIKFRV